MKKIEVTWSQDNAPAQPSAETLAVIQSAGFELLRHPPYSPFVFVLHGNGIRALEKHWTNQVHFSCRWLCWKV